MKEKLETNKEIRNDELKIAMIKLKLQNDDENANNFIENVKKANFIIPVVNDDKDGEYTLMLLANQDGDNFFQAYTDMDSLSKWNNDIEFKNVVLTFNEYANILSASEEEVKGIVINPFTENMVLDRETVKNIFIEDKLVIDEESPCDKKIIKIISGILHNTDKVDKAYLFNALKNNIPGYVLIIDTKDKNKSALFDKIGNEILKCVDINIDINSLDKQLFSDIAKKHKPFYIKNKDN